MAYAYILCILGEIVWGVCKQDFEIYCQNSLKNKNLIKKNKWIFMKNKTKTNKDRTNESQSGI